MFECVCEWFGMGGGNSLHASIFFFVNGGVRLVGAVKATSKRRIRAALKRRSAAFGWKQQPQTGNCGVRRVTLDWSAG